eukprot:4102658-Amphidinium_carterae.1
MTWIAQLAAAFMTQLSELMKVNGGKPTQWGARCSHQNQGKNKRGGGKRSEKSVRFACKQPKAGNRVHLVCRRLPKEALPLPKPPVAAVSGVPTQDEQALLELLALTKNKAEQGDAEPTQDAAGQRNDESAVEDLNDCEDLCMTGDSEGRPKDKPPAGEQVAVDMDLDARTR